MCFDVVLKYIGYHAELPVPLPKDLQGDVFQMMELGVSQSKNVANDSSPLFVTHFISLLHSMKDVNCDSSTCITLKKIMRSLIFLLKICSLTGFPVHYL